MLEKIKLHAYISGRVQGVGFRYSTQWKAQSLGLTGWVRNLDDGRVETIAYGGESAINAFIEWLHKGPRMADVSEVIFTTEKIETTPKENHSFRITY